MRALMAMIMMAILALLGCGGSETTGSGAGGSEATTAADGGGGAGGGCADPHDAECVPYRPQPDPKVPIAFGPNCAINIDHTEALGPIVPGDGLTDEDGNLLSESGALMVRCEPVPEPMALGSVEYAMTNIGPCDSLPFDVYAWALSDLPTSLRLDDAIAHERVESVLFDAVPGSGGISLAQRDLDLKLSVQGGYVCFGATLTAESLAKRSCLFACQDQVPETPDLDLYSDTIGGIVKCPDENGECILEGQDVSPTPETASLFKGASRALRVQWFGTK